MESRNIQTFSPEQEAMLKEPLDINAIKHRQGAGGMVLKYIKGDTAIDTANRIFGYGQWGYKVVSRGHEMVEDRKNGPTDVYTADVELYVAGAAFPFPGDGMGIVGKPYTVEMHEKARKEATTDALKRALRHYGDQFGLCLYNEDDYVDAGDGTLVQVKEVKPGRNAAQPKRVVDAQHQAKQLPPVPDKIPTPSELRARAEALFPGKWEDVKARTIGAVSDGEMTPEQCIRVHRSLEIAEEKRKAVSA